MKSQIPKKTEIRKLGIKEIEENETLKKQFFLIEKRERPYALGIHYNPENVDEYWIYFMTKKYGVPEGSELKLDLKLGNDVRFFQVSQFGLHLYNDFSLHFPRNIISTLELLQTIYFRAVEIQGIRTYEVRKEVFWFMDEQEIVKDHSDLPMLLKKKFVYITLSKNTGLYKIGFSINPYKREKTLQAEDPELEMITFFEADQSVEAEIHRKLKSKRVRGEYFKLSLKELKDAEKFILQKSKAR